jgi:hypothetical protein
MIIEAETRIEANLIGLASMFKHFFYFTDGSAIQARTLALPSFFSGWCVVSIARSLAL